MAMAFMLPVFLHAGSVNDAETEYSPELKEKISQYLDEIKGKDSWWSAQSKHFVMISDNYDNKFGSELLKKLEKERDIISQVYPVSEKSPELIFILPAMQIIKSGSLTATAVSLRT